MVLRLAWITRTTHAKGMYKHYSLMFLVELEEHLENTVFVCLFLFFLPYLLFEPLCFIAPHAGFVIYTKQTKNLQTVCRYKCM